MATFTIEAGKLGGFAAALKDYPIFMESYRDSLNDKIIDHFYFREIGFETPEMFYRFVRRKMNEVMPLYNQLYSSLELVKNPLYNYDMETTSESEQRGSGTQEASGSESSNTVAKSDSEGKSRNVASNTPQMQLAGHEDYATNIADSITDSSAGSDTTAAGTSASTSSGSSSSTARAMQRVSGVSGMTEAQALQLYRDTFLNVDLMVIDELEPLFMGVYTADFLAW
jgi:hypothetical protein